MANTPIDKAYLLQTLKDFDATILKSSYVEKYATYAEMPVASSTTEGKIVQYIGTDDSTHHLTNGFFYEVVEGTTAGTYEWAEKATMSGPDGVEYSIVRESTPDTGYFATYQLYGKVGSGTPAPIVGSEKINIPMDFLVKSAEVKTVTAADKQQGGIFYNDPDFEEGDKYIDFVVNVKSGTAIDEHIYLNVKDLVDVYTPGAGITIDGSNEVSVKVGTNKGLEFTGSDSDELSVKVTNSDQVTLSLTAAGLSASLLLADATDPTEKIDFDTEW